MISSEPGFRHRGMEPGRLENFSDAVFGMAITLLLISTTPPDNFDHLKRFTYELFPFLACITLIVLIWHEHYIFFLRYGLRNGTSERATDTNRGRTRSIRGSREAVAPPAAPRMMTRNSLPRQERKV